MYRDPINGVHSVVPDYLKMRIVSEERYLVQMGYNNLNKKVVGIYISNADILKMAKEIMNREANRLLRK